MWNCSRNRVKMVCDTTASNCGHLTAACLRFLKQLGRPFLCLGCCHHIEKIALFRIFKYLKIETSKSPDISMFLRLCKHFDAVTINTNMVDILSQILDERVAKDIVQWTAYSLIVLYGDYISTRDDYAKVI